MWEEYTMFKSLFIYPIWLFSLLVPLSMLTCRGPEGPQGPAGPVLPGDVFITGEISYNSMGEKTSYAQVEISNCEVFPGVSINDIELKSSLSYGSFRFTGNNLPIFPEDEVRLLVTSDGTAQVIFNMPGEFEITSHDSLIVLPLGQDLSVNWSTSNFAEFYAVHVFLHYSWIDYNNKIHTDDYILDTLSAKNQITIPSHFIFPDLNQISSITSSVGYFDVAAGIGPWKEEDSGNVTGDATGFFNGRTNIDDIDLVIENSDRSTAILDDHPYRVNGFLEKMRLKFIGDYRFLTE
jgi:hypothetical protein